MSIQEIEKVSISSFVLHRQESWGTQEKGVLTAIIEALGNFYYGVYLMFSLFLYIVDILKMIA